MKMSNTSRGIMLAAMLTGIASVTAIAGEAKVDSLNVKVWDAKQQEGIQPICDEWSETSGVKVNVS